MMFINLSIHLDASLLRTIHWPAQATCTSSRCEPNWRNLAVNIQTLATHRALAMVAAATLVLNNLRPMRALALNMVVVNIKAVTQALVIKTAAVEAVIQAEAVAVEAVIQAAAVAVELVLRLLLHGKRMSIRMSNFRAPVI
jgi:hypothetical protein